MNERRYYDRMAVAAIRGECLEKGVQPFREADILDLPLEGLTTDDIEEIIAYGKETGFKLYHFKASHSELPRIKKVMGFLHSISLESLCDVGSGRGAFLLPFMETFPRVKVTAVDILPQRIAFLKQIHRGGIGTIKAG